MEQSYLDWDTEFKRRHKRLDLTFRGCTFLSILTIAGTHVLNHTEKKSFETISQVQAIDNELKKEISLENITLKVLEDVEAKKEERKYLQSLPSYVQEREVSKPFSLGYIGGYGIAAGIFVGSLALYKKSNKQLIREHKTKFKDKPIPFP